MGNGASNNHIFGCDIYILHIPYFVKPRMRAKVILNKNFKQEWPGRNRPGH